MNSLKFKPSPVLYIVDFCACESNVIIKICSGPNTSIYIYLGAQWLSGRVFDLTEGPRVRASLVSLGCGP